MEVVAVSGQTPEQNKAMGLPFPLLSDPDLATTTSYGLLHPKGHLFQDAPRPTTILVNKGDRNILWLKAADHVRVRPTVEEVFEALRK